MKDDSSSSGKAPLRLGVVTEGFAEDVVALVLAFEIDDLKKEYRHEGAHDEQVLGSN